MKEKYEVIMAGSGGQGLIVCGMMLAEAAMLEDKNVVQTQSYGIASRGGFSKSEVILSSGEIIFQQVLEPDMVLALTEEAMEIYAGAGSAVPVFYDTTLLESRQGENLYGFPFTDMASQLGNVGMANIIALGAMATLNKMVKLESLEAVLRKRFKEKLAEMNVKALRAGADLILTYK